MNDIKGLIETLKICQNQREQKLKRLQLIEVAGVTIGSGGGT